jgi:ribosomal protein S4
MLRLYKKNRVLKSNKLTSNEILLNRLENRLDVVVYRLNLAPTIL